MKEYDFLVIGGGSGGVRFARIMGAKGYKVALFEKEKVGGTCVLKGCIPKKLLIYASNPKKDFKYAKNIGWEGISLDELEFDIKNFIFKKNIELERLSNIYSNLLLKNNVEIIYGEAKFNGKNSVDVNGKTYCAKKIIVANGSVPKTLNIEGFDLTIDSEQFLMMDKVVKSVLVLGGGYIATEFVNILLSLGVKVYMFIRSGIVLRGFDSTISKHMKEQLEKQGVIFIKANNIEKITNNAKNTYKVMFNTNEELIVDKVVSAIGREANTKNLNLEAANISCNEFHKSIRVNDFFQTDNENVFAIGDVIDKVNLTPVATKQAMFLVDYFENKISQPFDYNYIPKAVFGNPEIASVGFTEEECKAKKISIDVYISTFKPLKYTLTDIDIKSVFKIIVEKESQKVIGIHICDIHAAEIMQGFAVALKLGVTKKQLDSVIGIHPTSAEELVTMYTKSYSV